MHYRGVIASAEMMRNLLIGHGSQPAAQIHRDLTRLYQSLKERRSLKVRPRDRVVATDRLLYRRHHRIRADRFIGHPPWTLALQLSELFFNGAHARREGRHIIALHGSVDGLGGSIGGLGSVLHARESLSARRGKACQISSHLSSHSVPP